MHFDRIRQFSSLGLPHQQRYQQQYQQDTILDSSPLTDQFAQDDDLNIKSIFKYLRFITTLGLVVIGIALWVTVSFQPIPSFEPLRPSQPTDNPIPPRPLPPFESIPQHPPQLIQPPLNATGPKQSDLSEIPTIPTIPTSPNIPTIPIIPPPPLPNLPNDSDSSRQSELPSIGDVGEIPPTTEDEGEIPPITEDEGKIPPTTEDEETKPYIPDFTRIPTSINERYKKTAIYHNLTRDGGNGYMYEPIPSVIKREYAYLDPKSDRYNPDLVKYYPNHEPDFIPDQSFPFPQYNSTKHNTTQPYQDVNPLPPNKNTQIHRNDGDMKTSLWDKHPFFTPKFHLPTIPSSVTESKTSFKRSYNTSIQPLPPNPKGYRYFLTQRLYYEHTKEWKSAYPSVRHTHGQHQVISTCFADWFPLEMIDHHHKVANRGQNRWNDFIDMDQIDKDQLAGYYGYKLHADMPYHPHVPFTSRLSPSNVYQNIKGDPRASDQNDIDDSGWSLECVTSPKPDLKWSQDQDPKYYRHFYPNQGLWAGPPQRRGKSWTGPEDNRLSYDRCGRLVAWFGQYNDLTPFAPNWTVWSLDARRFDPNGLLFKPFELCKHRYWERIMTQYIDNQYDGHEALWEKNHNELPYGFAEGDITSMLSFQSLFLQHSTSFDIKTNTYLLTQTQYDLVKSKLLETTVGKNKEVLFNPIFDYLNHNPVLIRSISPLSFSKGSLRFVEQTQNNSTDIYNSFNYQSTKGLREGLLKNTAIRDLSNLDRNLDRTTIIEKNLVDITLTLFPDNAQPSTEHNIPPHSTTYQYPQSLPTGLNPNTYLNDLSNTHLRFDGFDRKNTTTSFTRCLLEYQGVRPYETSFPHNAKRNHLSTNSLLLHLSDEDWGFEPSINKKSNDPSLSPHQSEYPSWVYVSITHELDDNYFYRQVVTFINAITLELIAIQPLHFDTPSKCKNDDCLSGVGTGCGFCGFIYAHALWVNSTPLSFTIVTEDGNNGNNHNNGNNGNNGNNHDGLLQSLHTVLPTFHTLDSDWIVSINIDDRIPMMQELNMKSIWRNRFSCKMIATQTTETSTANMKKDPKDPNNPKDQTRTTPSPPFPSNIPTRDEFQSTFKSSRNVIERKYRQGEDKMAYLSTLRQNQEDYLLNPNLRTPHPNNDQIPWVKHNWILEDPVIIMTQPREVPVELVGYGDTSKTREFVEFEFWNWDLHHERLKLLPPKPTAPRSSSNDTDSVVDVPVLTEDVPVLTEDVPVLTGNEPTSLNTSQALFILFLFLTFIILLIIRVGLTIFDSSS